MPTVIYPLPTNAGIAAAIDPAGNGLALAITHVQLGTGQYSVDLDVNPAAAALTALVAPTEARPIAGGYVTGLGQFRVDVLFPEWLGVPNPYNANEIGFFAGDPAAGGILFAVYSHPVTPLTLRGALPYLATFKCALSRIPPGAITIVFDPDESIAAQLMADHEADANPHPQYVRWDAPQGLTAAQRSQARQNIGVPSKPHLFFLGQN